MSPSGIGISPDEARSLNGEFGELVRRLSRMETTWSHPDDALRKPELLQRRGLLSDAFEEYLRLLQFDPYNKPPLSDEISRRIDVLEKTMVETNYRHKHYTTNLSQLNNPIQAMHFKESPLPRQYVQPHRDDRLTGALMMNTTSPDPVQAVFPALTGYSYWRLWRGKAGQELAVIQYTNISECLLVSRDGGKTWLGPYLLGMHRLPDSYRIVYDSKLPLLNGDNVQIEVAIFEIDKTKPYGGLARPTYKRIVWDRMLTTPLASLTKDSDGDGLTDLLEERILTDPYNRDTDGDGLDDAVDNQPLTPFSGKLTDVDQLFLALVRDGANHVGFFFMDFATSRTEYHSSLWGASQRTLTPEALKFLTVPSSKPIRIEDTHFLLSEIDCATGITGKARVIVLSEDAMRRYNRKILYGVGYGYSRVGPIVVDDAHRKAFFEFSEGNTGEEFLFLKDHGTWESRSIGSWIAD
jgi:hypothetical protein